MKLTKTQLKQIIKEELLREGEDPIVQIHQKLNQAMKLIKAAYDASEGDADARNIVGSVVDELYRRFGRHPKKKHQRSENLTIPENYNENHKTTT
jgi:hypothetical protein